LAIGHRFKGFIFLDEGELLQALNEFNLSLELDSTEINTIEARGQCYQKLNMKERACIDFRRAADLGRVKLYDVISEYCN
jgi:Tfp pilus assembly protein PilF